MEITTKICLSCIWIVPLLICAGPARPDSKPAPIPIEYNADGQLRFPASYREWVFLGSGLGMTYGPMAEVKGMDKPLFDTVFVNPESYRAFVNSGHWPDKTIFVLEVRNSESHRSINRDGHFQTELVGVEAEVKDSSAKSGEWTFYGFGAPKNPAAAFAKAIGRSASCYSCHRTNTAVENTFVQFYPEVYEIAKKKGTLNAGFVK